MARPLPVLKFCGATGAAHALKLAKPSHLPRYSGLPIAQQITLILAVSKGLTNMLAAQSRHFHHRST